jgi:hypothetical protein
MTKYVQDTNCTEKPDSVPCPSKSELKEKETFFVADVESFTLLIDHSFVSNELNHEMSSWNMLGFVNPCGQGADLEEGIVHSAGKNMIKWFDHSHGNHHHKEGNNCEEGPKHFLPIHHIGFHGHSEEHSKELREGDVVMALRKITESNAYVPKGTCGHIVYGGKLVKWDDKTKYDIEMHTAVSKLEIGKDIEKNEEKCQKPATEQKRALKGSSHSHQKHSKKEKEKHDKEKEKEKEKAKKEEDRLLRNRGYWMWQSEWKETLLPFLYTQEEKDAVASKWKSPFKKIPNGEFIKIEDVMKLSDSSLDESFGHHSEKIIGMRAL